MDSGDSFYLKQEPRQARSRETMEQILDAAVALLETKSFDALTVAELVARAGTSVGAFYGRFNDKNALLHALDERFFARLEAELGDALMKRLAGKKSIWDCITTLTETMVTVFDREKGLIRSLSLLARLSDDPRFQERELRAWGTLLPQYLAILGKFRKKIRHPDPDTALLNGFRFMFFSLKECLLWEPQRTGEQTDKAALTAELIRAHAAYLGVYKPRSLSPPGPEKAKEATAKAADGMGEFGDVIRRK